MSVSTNTLLKLLAIALATASPGLAATFTSVQSGLWADPNTWDPVGVPGPLDDVIIVAGHTVGAADTASAPTPALAAADTLLIHGTLQPTFPTTATGRSLHVEAGAAITVGPSGTIRAESGVPPASTSSARSIRIIVASMPCEPVDGPSSPGVMVNSGSIVAGSVDTGHGGHIRIEADDFSNSGLIEGGSGTTGGGHVRIANTLEAKVSRVESSFFNSGSILGGDVTQSGGLVSIFYANGFPPPPLVFIPPCPPPNWCPPVPGDLFNEGLIAGGDGERGGGVSLVGLNTTNFGTIEGGDGLRGGAVRVMGAVAGFAIHCLEPSAFNSGTIRGGHGTTGPGGAAALISSGVGFGTANVNLATVAPGSIIRGGDGCTPGAASAFGATTIINGDVIAGGDLCPEPAVRVTRVDPPCGTLSGAAHLDADLIEIAAGESLTIGPFDTANAITAAEVQITLAPGGVLDLQGSSMLIDSDLVTVKADTLQLDDGVSLDDLFSGSPTLQDGDRYSNLEATDSWQLMLEAGTTNHLPVYLFNHGNLPEDVTLSIQDNSGWLVNPLIDEVEIASMSSVYHLLEIDVPDSATAGETTVITLSAESLDSPGHEVQRTYEVVVLADELGPPCFGDANGDGVVNVIDLTAVILDWGSDGSVNNGDVDGSGVVNVADLAGVILTWGPCP